MPYIGFFIGLLVPILIAGVIVLVARKRNDRFPQLTMPASVVAKRTYVRLDDGESFTFYYATFQFENGKRLELTIPRNQIGYLIEGDQGHLTFQGSRFLGFERT